MNGVGIVAALLSIVLLPGSVWLVLALALSKRMGRKKGKHDA